MKKTNSINKLALKVGVMSGVIFALVMAGFDLYEQKPFSILKFVLHLLFFGGLMFFLNRNKLKKNIDNNEK